MRTNTNVIVIGFTRPWLEPTIYRTQDEHANTNDAVHQESNMYNMCTYMNILKCTNCNDILDIELNDKFYRYCLSLTCLFPSLSFVSIL
jgi:hypothetical protein